MSLQRLMREKSLTVQEVSRLSGVNERTVYRHMKSETSMDLQQARKYAEALSVPIDELVLTPEPAEAIA